MVLPEMFLAAGTDFTPSMFARAIIGGSPSFQTSTASVGASVPNPEIGQISEPLLSTLYPAGIELGKSASALITPVARFGEQLWLCQSGALSLRMPKLEPPTSSR